MLIDTRTIEARATPGRMARPFISLSTLVIAVALAACSSTAPAPANPGAVGSLPPPASPEEGWQFAIPEFAVPPGAELQQCYFFEVPYDEPVYVSHIAIAQTEGTHHMNIFRVRSVLALNGNDGEAVMDGECWKPTNWADWPLVINSQNEGRVDVNLPDGVAHRFEAHEKLMVQTHYVNASTQVTPGVGKVFVNFDRTPSDRVSAELGTAFATNQSIEICPGDVNRSFQTTCRFARNAGVTIFGANGHFHSRGTLFTMSVYDSTGATGEQFYESRQWNEPTFIKGLDVAVPAQGGVSYSCDYTVPPDACGDPNNRCCFTFGGKVEFQEHCNAFVYYYPRNAETDVNCF